jgi:hypothetical protein
MWFAPFDKNYGLGPALMPHFRIETQLEKLSEVQASSSGLLSGRFLPITATLQVCTAQSEEQRLCRCRSLAGWTIHATQANAMIGCEFRIVKVIESGPSNPVSKHC